MLPVRDSKRPGGAVIVVSAEAWVAFVDQRTWLVQPTFR
ncbi:DUF397 domain-containing protein [Streptomyces flavofungini]